MVLFDLNKRLNMAARKGLALIWIYRVWHLVMYGRGKTSITEREHQPKAHCFQLPLMGARWFQLTQPCHPAVRLCIDIQAAYAMQNF